MSDAHPPVVPVLAELIALITRGRVAAEALGEDSALTKTGATLDSVEILELVVAIEDRLGVALGADDLVESHWRTLGTLASLVAGRMPR